MADSLIDAAYSDLAVVRCLLTYSADEAVFAPIGYHLQQAVEKSLKVLLEFSGYDYRELRHSIGRCLCCVKDYVPGVLSDDIIVKLEPHVNILTGWEIAGRYPSDFLFMLNSLQDIYVIAVQLYNECALYVGGLLFAVSEKSVLPADLFKNR